MAVEYKKVAYYLEMSIADSLLQSSVDAGGAGTDSEARSMAISAVSYASSADTSIVSAGGGSTDSVARSQAVSAVSYASSADVSVITIVNSASSSLTSRIDAGGDGIYRVFELDGSGDLQPLASPEAYDDLYELDVNDDVMPRV